MDFWTNADGSTNWDAIAAFSNILVAIGTFAAVVISLYVTINSNSTKTQIIYKHVVEPGRNFFRFRLINRGMIPIVILRKGILVNKWFWKNRKVSVVSRESKEWKIEQGENTNIIINPRTVNEKLITLGNKPGDRVKLIAVFVSNREQFYFKKFVYEVYDHKEHLKNIKIKMGKNYGVDFLVEDEPKQEET